MAALASTPAHTACTASLETAFSKNVSIRGSCARSFAPRTTVSFPAARTSGAALTCSRSQYAAAPGISTARAPQMQVICSAAAEGERTQRQPRFGGREDDGLEERVVQIKRVTKVVKGGKQLNFRAVVVVGDMNGRVGVGVAKAKEVITAVQNAVKDGKKHLEAVTVVKGKTFAHRADGRFGSAHVMLRPAGPGTGIIAGGAVRTVLELAGYENGFGKQLGSTNPLNNARATVEGLKLMKTHKMVAEERGIDVKELYW